MRLFLTFFFLFFINTLYCQPLYRSGYEKQSKITKQMQLRGKFQLNDTSFIDTNAVYIDYKIKEYSNFDDGPDTLYYFERFFKNGQYFQSGYYCSFPTDEEFNDLAYGRRGYYIINNDSILTVETYHDRHNEYQLISYFIKEDGLLLYEIKTYLSYIIIFKYLYIKEEFNVFFPFERTIRRYVNFYTKATW
jgi:hypothetical protein